VARMKDELVRFGIAMEASLLEAFDEVVARRGGSRSEALRDLARAEVVRSQVRTGADAVGTLTIVYDHHVRELTERLTDIQHELGAQVHCVTHVHIDHHRCLEVIVLRGKSDHLHSIADKITATRGVIHGGLDLVTDVPHKAAGPRALRGESGPDHAHVHGHAAGVQTASGRAKRKTAKKVAKRTPAR
jgi:CopG family nickel-responsive transcriptional regulator